MYVTRESSNWRGNSLEETHSRRTIRFVPAYQRVDVSGLKAVNEELQKSMDSLKAELHTDRQHQRCLGQMQTVLSMVGTQPARKKESYYQAMLSGKLNAGHMRIEGVGVTDITTPEAHIEIKAWARFQGVPGQLAKYQQAVKRDKVCVYFFGPEPSGERYEQILALMEVAGIEVFSFGPDDEVHEHRQHVTMSIVDRFARDRLVRQEGITLKRPDGIRAMREWAQENERPSRTVTSMLLGS